MKINHIQSLIAINATRINNMHAEQEELKADVRHLNGSSKIYNKFVQNSLETSKKSVYNRIDALKKNIAKAVEMQKALQDSLRQAQRKEKAEKTSQKPFEKIFYTNGAGWIDGTYCVEISSPTTYVCHNKDGSSSKTYTSKSCAENYAGCSDFVAHKERQYPPSKQAPGIYSIDEDGQPKQDGVYDVMYEWQKTSTEQREFRDGEWYDGEGHTCFGNMATQGERYIVK